jgi:hypothetical protein
MLDRSHHREPGVDRPDRVVFMRQGVAEIHEDAVAHVLRHVAAEAADLARRRVLIGPGDLSQFLRIQLQGQLGRSNQIDKHHRELPTLGLGLHKAGIRALYDFGEARGGIRTRLAQSCNCLNQPPSVPDRGNA